VVLRWTEDDDTFLWGTGSKVPSVPFPIFSVVLTEIGQCLLLHLLGLMTQSLPYSHSYSDSLIFFINCFICSFL
jgi:hypothetical protein